MMKKLIVSVALLSAVQVFAESKPLCGDDHYCVGSRVVGDDGISGEIAGIFQSGSVAVKFDGRPDYTMRPTSRLARTNGCSIDHYCVGSRVVGDDGISGEIAGIFQSGSVAVKFDGRPDYTMRPTSRLARTDGCSIDHYCVGSRVVGDDGISGEIAGIFQEGSVAVKVSGRSDYIMRPTSRLTKTKSCADVPSCLHRMSDITNSDQQSRQFEARISDNRSKPVSKIASGSAAPAQTTATAGPAN